MLPGLIVTTAHPSAINCSIAGGSTFAGGAAGPRPAPGGPPLPGNTGAGNATSGMLRPPNIIIAGAGDFAWAGITTVIWISTLISGYDALSTCPRSCFPITGCEPTIASADLVTSQVTFGAVFGTRPTTSLSKSSTISGRRWFHHCAFVVTFLPFFRVRTSGRSGYG